MKKLENQENIKKEKDILKIALKNKKIHFINEAKITGLYTKKLEKLYDCYLDEIEQNEDMLNDAEINTNFTNELKKLFDYIDWYDEIVDNIDELKISSTDNILRFKD